MSLRASRRVFTVAGRTLPFMGKGHPDFIHPKHPEFGKKSNPTIKDYTVNVIRDTLQSTNTPASLIQRVYVANFAGELFCSQGHLGAAVAEAHPDLMYVPSMRVEGACASGGLAFASAVDAVKAGVDVVMAVGTEVQNTVSARVGGDYLARASDYQRQRSLDDFTFPAMFAMRMKAYLTKYGGQNQAELREAIDAVALKAYRNGNKNPLAHMKNVKLDKAGAASSANFLGNEELKEWLKLCDCSQVSDGASALYVVSEEGLKKMGLSHQDAVEVLACEYTTGNLFNDDGVDLTKMQTSIVAIDRAVQAAGINHGDIKVAEVHDCFTIAEVLMTEALRIAKPGEGAYAIRDGVTDLNGAVPVNTGGGLVAMGHPVGATGIKQVNEVVKQMKRQAGDYQIAATPEIGACVNMGGADKTCVATVLKNL